MLKTVLDIIEHYGKGGKEDDPSGPDTIPGAGEAEAE